MECKTGVDPNFAFNIKDKKEDNVFYFPITSDEFFSNMAEYEKNYYKNKIKFDIVYIDGLHTFDQSYRDFLNSLPFCHDKTIWIFDDTIPSDPYSSVPNMEESLKYRKLANIAYILWHGDVYKTVFAIHDFNPEFSYITVINNGNPQTIVWKNSFVMKRKRIFSNINEIEKLNYFDLCNYCHIMNIEVWENFFDKVWTNITSDEKKKDMFLEKIIKPLHINK